MTVSHPDVVLLPVQEGEFTRMKGIGPDYAQRLRDAGFATFAQLAQAAPDDICAALEQYVIDHPGAKRLKFVNRKLVANQDWAGQAARLAQELAAARGEGSLPCDPPNPHQEQTYHVFSVELLMDGRRVAQRTRVQHAQTGAKDAWLGWDAEHLIQWIAQAACLAQPAVEPPAPELPPEKPQQPVVNPRVLAAAALAQSGKRTRVVSAQQPCAARLALNARETGAAPGTPLAYRAEILARIVGNGRWVRAGSAQGILVIDGPCEVEVPLETLPAGIYRLECSITVTPPGGPPLQAFHEGGLVQVMAS